MALLNDVLDLTKIEAGKLEISAVPGDFLHTMKRTRQLFQAQAEDKGLDLFVRYDSNFPQRLSLRSGARAPVRVEPALQRHQVHRAGPRRGGDLGASRMGDGAAHGRASTIMRHRHRHERGDGRQAVHRVHAGRRRDDAQVRRLGPRPRDLAPARAHDGRRHHGRKRRGEGLDLPSYLQGRRRRRLRRQPRQPQAAKAEPARRSAARHARAADRRQRHQPPGHQAVPRPAGLRHRRGDQRQGSARHRSPSARVRPRAARRPHAGDGRQGSDRAHPRQSEMGVRCR